LSDNVELLKRIYDRFNARDMETVLAALHKDVIWANGMEGGHVHGREGVRSYWTRQWAVVDPHVEPVAFAEGPKAQVIVEVHQVVRDLKGNLLVDKMVGHIFQVENGLVRRFDIREIDAIPVLRVLRPDHGQRGRDSITSWLPTRNDWALGSVLIYRVCRSTL
jgi:hypothetical protein